MPQIIYNVTNAVEEQIIPEWLEWMRRVHIPEVMQTGLFLEYKFLRVIGALGEEDSGGTYAVQYVAESIEKFLDYAENHAPALRAKTQERYGERVMAFRTLLEMMD
ncbi:MAG: DUF4286 family protein [Bacteroidetes bacterium]|nr:MAG: DUF4286 family protein [Bacteroidota bacterium]